MKLSDFAKEVMGITRYIHTYFARCQSIKLLKGKVTIPQMVIASILSGKKDCKMGDLADALGVTKSAITGITDRLVKTGLIKRWRCASDRRIVKVGLTESGVGLVKRLNESNRRMIEQLFSNISTKDRVHYVRILKDIKKNLQKKMRA